MKILRLLALAIGNRKRRLKRGAISKRLLLEGRVVFQYCSLACAAAVAAEVARLSEPAWEEAVELAEEEETPGGGTPANTLLEPSAVMLGLRRNTVLVAGQNLSAGAQVLVNGEPVSTSQIQPDLFQARLPTRSARRRASTSSASRREAS